MINRLQKLNLVERRPDPTDRRARLLYLSNGADRVLENLRVRANVVIEQSTDVFTPKEVSQLVELLKRMRECLIEPYPKISEPKDNG
jgi:DNA-binding MarR family transcriptional regulator